MKNLTLLCKIILGLLFVSCSSRQDSKPNIVGSYECEFDETKYVLSLYEDSTFMQSMLNKVFGEIQSNGKFKFNNDTLCLMDEYYISDGKTIAVKDYELSLSESEKNRMFKLISFDGDNLILRDLRTQRVCEYHVKER